MNVIPGTPVWEVSFGAVNPAIIFWAAGLFIIYLGLRLLMKEVILRRR